MTPASSTLPSPGAPLLSSTPLLSAAGLSAGYDAAIIIENVSLELGAGETLALLGRNGTGKTTLINTLVGATVLHAGTIHLDAVPLHGLPSHLRAAAGVGWVPQERSIFRSLTVLENLTAVARAPRPGPPPRTPERVFEFFPRLAERRRNLGTQLSGGEQQMLAIGRALVLNPRLLLLDEPLEGLAPIIVEELLAAIARITRDEGLSAIIVEQHPQAILAISERAVVLDQGRVAFAGAAVSLRDDAALLASLIGVGGSAA